MTDRQIMTCARVDTALLDYLEETLDGNARAQIDEHVASCLRCNSLLRDIGAIRAEAEQLPDLAPSRDLWAGIAARIEPTVVPLGRSPREVRRNWMPAAAAAAAALVIATAGITYVATSRSMRPATQRVAVTAKPKSAPQQSAVAPSVAPSEPINTEMPSTTPSEVATTRPAERETAPKIQSSRAVTLASRSRSASASPTEIAYGDEISRLQNIITDRRNQLDPNTVAVIEQSLKIIDAAVRQSRAALARDPKSGFLTDQLNHALDKKVELLRTVALLPSRT
ncbi:MAG: zf-HC2 domain-containing protein [Gemmatimonadaceae bacterium]